MSDEIEISKSGAKSTKMKVRYDLVPSVLLHRVASRYALGANNYSDYNWRTGVADEDFVQSRINHMIAHLQKFLQDGDLLDDNLSAIGWAVSMLMEFEAHPVGRITLERVRARMNFREVEDENFEAVK